MSLSRVVEAGRDGPRGSTITRDESVEPRLLPTGRGLVELWHTDHLVEASTAPPSAPHGPFPAVNGARLWQLVIPPDDPTAPSPFHATATVDLGFVLQGQVTLEVEDGSATELREGDAFVQVGAPHRWVNRSQAAAVIGVVVVGTGGRE
jgi:Cupin domain